jgi:hypothetical protein
MIARQRLQRLRPVINTMVLKKIIPFEPLLFVHYCFAHHSFFPIAFESHSISPNELVADRIPWFIFMSPYVSWKLPCSDDPLPVASRHSCLQQIAQITPQVYVQERCTLFGPLTGRVAEIWKRSQLDLWHQIWCNMNTVYTLSECAFHIYSHLLSFRWHGCQGILHPLITLELWGSTRMAGIASEFFIVV